MKNLRNIALIILIPAVVLTSMYLLYNRYIHDRVITQMSAQQRGALISAEANQDTVIETQTQANGEEVTKKVDEKKAYNFELEDINGKKIKLLDYKGKRVVICFCTTWSPYCIDEMPELQSVRDKLKDGKEAVILLIDVSEDSETVKKFVKKNELTLPVLLDIAGDIAGIYGIQSFPAIIFVNSDGTVYGDIPRFTDEETILAVIDKMK